MKRRKVNLSLKGGGGEGGNAPPPQIIIIIIKKSIKSKHLKCSTERYLLEQKRSLQIFGVIPFVKLQTTVKM